MDMALCNGVVSGIIYRQTAVHGTKLFFRLSFVAGGIIVGDHVANETISFEKCAKTEER